MVRFQFAMATVALIGAFLSPFATQNNDTPKGKPVFVSDARQPSPPAKAQAASAYQDPLEIRVEDLEQRVSNLETSYKAAPAAPAVSATESNVDSKTVVDGFKGSLKDLSLLSTKEIADTLSAAGFQVSISKQVPTPAAASYGSTGSSYGSSGSSVQGYGSSGSAYGAYSTTYESSYYAPAAPAYQTVRGPLGRRYQVPVAGSAYGSYGTCRVVNGVTVCN